MTVTIERGMYGMYYGTDLKNAAIFVASKTEPEVREHIRKIHEGEYPGTVVLHPGEDQTPNQRAETIARLRKVLGKPSQ